MAALDATISRLEDQLKKAKARRQKMDSRKRAVEAKKARSQDTRRKILAGAVMLTRAAQDDDVNVLLRSALDEALTRPDDRALFNFLTKDTNNG
jgi:hypothetical protein